MIQQDALGHVGEIISLEGNQVKVLIKSSSACSSCHAKGACNSADFQDKYIDGKVEKSEDFSLGEKVFVNCGDNQGFYALFWAYILPLFLVVFFLFFGFTIWEDELNAGLLSLGVLPLYYIALYVKRKFFAKKLEIKIKKIYS